VILSHSKQFIFFAVPKTGTHAVREVLREGQVDGDWEQQVLFGQQYSPIAEIAKIGHGHVTAQQLAPHLDPILWRNYFKFAFVRNPYDRFISICFFLNRNNPAFAESPLEWMKLAAQRSQFRNRVLVMPQYLQLINNERRLALDFIGRYETLQASVDEVCKNLQIPVRRLKKTNTSEHKGYREYYDEELKCWVESYYRDDLKHFNYGY
tara:strand:- start:1337 stop:1960 length:624 start_codon:yes stop_codon:yes gene_type:complete